MQPQPAALNADGDPTNHTPRSTASLAMGSARSRRARHSAGVHANGSTRPGRGQGIDAGVAPPAELGLVEHGPSSHYDSSAWRRGRADTRG